MSSKIIRFFFVTLVTSSLFLASCNLENGKSDVFKSGNSGHLGKTLGAFESGSMRTGRVRLSGKAFADDGGEFNALGATLFDAAHWYKFDRDRLERALQTLSDNGYDYIRALGTVGAPPAWTGKEIDPNWSDYNDVIAGVTDLAYDKYGLRVQWTIFGDAQVMAPSDANKQSVVDAMINMSRGREQKILLFEVVNEYYGNGLSADDVRKFMGYLKGKTSILVAGTAPNGDGGDCAERGGIYSGGIADLMTLETDRDISGQPDGQWRPVRQGWGEISACSGMPSAAINVEPIGPGSSGASEDDPTRIAMHAVSDYIAQFAGFAFHSRAGIGMGLVSGYSGDAEISTMPGVDAFIAMKAYLPAGIQNWTPQNHYWAGHPFNVFGDEKQNFMLADGAQNGALRAIAATSGNSFVVAPIEIKGYLKLQAKNAMEFDVLNPVTGEVLDHKILAAGDSFNLAGSSSGTAYVIIGKNGTPGVYPPGSTPTPTPPGPRKFGLGKLQLNANQSVKADGVTLVLQNDGNLVIYDSSSKALWATNTSDKDCESVPCSAIFQGDGNLVLYRSGAPYWASNTTDKGATTLLLQGAAPNIEILDGSGNVLFSGPAVVPGTSPTPAPTPKPPTSTPTPQPSPSPSSGSGVMFFLDINYSGASSNVSADQSDLRNIALGSGNWNDAISSMQIPAGTSVIAYTDINYGGASVTLTGNQADLRNQGFNDLISSFKIISSGGSLPTPVPTPAPTPAPPGSCNAGSSFSNGGWALQSDCLRKQQEGTFSGSCELNSNGCYGIP